MVWAWHWLLYLVAVAAIVLALTLDKSGSSSASSSNIAPARDTAEVYVTLTTIPERLQTAYFRRVVENLLSQKPTVLRLNIPYVYERTGEPYVLPDWLQQYPSIQVVRGPDLGPVTKILGGVDTIPDEAVVVVLDDDLIYKEFVVSDLTHAALTRPGKISCFNIWKDSSWVAQGLDLWLPGGFSGCSGSAKTFKRLKSIPQFDACRVIDDHWLGWAYHRLGIPLQYVDRQWENDHFHSLVEGEEHPAWYELVNHTNRDLQRILCFDAITK